MTQANQSRPPLPPFTRETAMQKVRMAEDGWNSRDPIKVSLAYTIDSEWRNRAEFPRGRAQIVEFLCHKWEREIEYRLIKELWAYEANRIAVRFAYEWKDQNNNWTRSYGNENWEFDEHGLMQKRYASINDLAISESERKFHWPQGRRPDDHPSLSELGL
ncbi:nuclear transport factor 2 family protein [Undibacterium jejuense]|uniref:Nuclear transport factor 2 family protein n=1 Tax=Undibacterium jejuense TaxID=1344949 RepID=A0A923KPE7_9BURK|nr:nuclear transport factor 2 family protein [Undibacterium jejuense]MBC3861611.1 nuclear transport factor 2 family protein [Undibacterium jejuense]